MITTFGAPGHSTTRRAWLRSVGRAGLAFGLYPLGLRADAAGAGTSPRFRIGACDWSIGRMANPEAFDVARAIGLDGVQVSLGTAANDMHLRRAEVQATYREALERTGLQVGSLAIGELNNIPYKSDPRTVEWVADSIDVCRAFGCRCVLLAFFYNGDLKGDAAGTDEVVRRLREVAPKAEKAGVSLGIESWLSAEEHVAIIDRVGSPAVKVYYDVANSSKMGYDIYREIRWLGNQGLICEFHAKENGFLLGEGVVDFRRVRQALDEIGYSGWVQIEGAVPSGGAMKESYVANQRFLRSVLG
ncbi:MAG: TIM barrel protein [Verrucomicrobiales bacterium]|nr:TIM barrel protein [Verrucomicrobiales bacterium]MCP5525213.1 TIM barrel protein [Verrucomicrobiales bacterium]